MSPFDPLGEVARWKIIYEALVRIPVDGVLTYEEMADRLGLHPEDDRHAIQMAMRRAARELEDIEKRAVDSLPNVGYRVVRAGEHLRLARTQQKRSTRALARGHSKVVNVDLGALGEDERKAFEVVAQAFSMMMDYNRRLDTRQRKLEQAVGAMVQRHDRSDAEISELRERLARLESGGA